ncbi:phosphoglycerate mutase family protein [Daphnia sinensis]|uniref:Phosphoglycerate mutase family protein n=1 Tax=Daphnia sinensis TaxID=1820382 RepID=A0AAD5PLG4_9CRUS|nr:phosphoglycerate mutase family protein [Daphnia sinensis]
MIKERADGWEYTLEQMLDIVKNYDNQPVTEVHIVGAIHKHRPELHVKALTPVEYHYIFKKAKVDYATGMKLMKEAGLDSMPGGGAEIFAPEIREIIAKDKCTGEQWLQIHEEWHKLGMRSNATMLYGHIEKFEHRIDHLDQLRKLQDKTGGFQTFIPLKFRNQDNQMSHIPEVSVIEDLRNYAISRIYLDNFDHIKAYWAMISRSTAQLSLNFGVDDIDGTLDDTTKIYSMAGAEEQHPAMSTQELVELIKQIGRHPVERDTLYKGRGMNTELNEKGRAQAEAFYQAYKDVPFDKIYTSTLKRTHQTVQKFIDNHIPWVQFPGLDELGWGIHEGQESTEKLRSDFHEITEHWKAGNLHHKFEKVKVH